MNTQLAFPGLEPKLVQPFRFPPTPYEYKVTALRECPMPTDLCDTDGLAADYWRRHVPTHPHFNPEVECLVAIIVNARRRVKGHYLIGIGIQDSVMVHPREVFRLAICVAAHSIILTHNHPGGDPTPSESDIRVNRDMIRAGRLLKIDILDHIVIGAQTHASMRSLGYCEV